MATGIPKLENLPGVKVIKNDGNLAPESLSTSRGVLVIGTASKGQGDRGAANRAFHQTTVGRPVADRGGKIQRGRSRQRRRYPMCQVWRLR